MTNLATSIIIRLSHSGSVAHFLNIYIVLVCNNKLSITNEKIHFLYICTIIIRIERKCIFSPCCLNPCGQVIYTHLMEGIENKDWQLIRVPSCSLGGLYNTLHFSHSAHLMAFGVSLLQLLITLRF